jgi:hypothetical protein
MTNGSAKNEAMITWERFDLTANIMAKKMAVKKASIRILVSIKSSRKGARTSRDIIKTSRIRNRL